MGIKNKTIFQVAFTFLLTLTSINLAAKQGFNVNKADADMYEYVNDLSGIYKVISHVSDDVEYGLDIYGGHCSTTDDSSPAVQVHQIGNPAQANQRFEFHFVETVDDRAVYYITSCLDNNGRVSTKGGTIEDSNTIWYHGFTQDNAEKWCVRTSDDGDTFKICNAYHPELFLSYNADDNNCVLSNDPSDVKTNWQLKLIAGDYGINTKTYLLEDNVGYQFNSSNERWRYLEPNGQTGCISDIINVGVSGEGIVKTTLDDVQTFAVPYDSKFYINTSFVYANSVYSSWTQGKELGKASCDGGYLTWWVNDDSWQFNSLKDTFSKEVDYGLYGIEVSNDNKNWQFYRLLSFGTENNLDYWEIDGDLIAGGIYVRVSFMFEIKTTWKEGWWIFASEKSAVKNVREVSDSFYVCADGFGEDDFGILTISNKSSKDALADVDNGLTMEEKTFSETLVNGSLTTTGFEISSRYPSYKIEVSKNDEEFVEVSSGYTQEESGKYTVKATSRFGKTRQVDVYVTRSEELVETYFGKTFANEPNDVAFIEGTRILSGENDYLNALGITLNYSYSPYPVYKKGCSVNVKHSDYALPLSGNIYYENTDGEHTIEVNTSTGDFTYTLNDIGCYSAELHTSNDIGDVLSFRFTWVVVDTSPGPMINELLIKTKTQETYDLIPTYYGVRVDEGRDIFKENGQPVEKIKSLYYAFATYDRAYNFALRVEKEYAMYKGNGVYTYKDTESKRESKYHKEIFR